MPPAQLYQRILITGSNGVAGGGFKIIQRHYPDRQFIFSTSKDCDLTDLKKTREYFNEAKADAVIHLAALSGGIELSKNHPATLLRQNVLMNFSVLEASRAAGIKKTLLSLSSGMYPADAPVPFGEEEIHRGAPHPSNYSYAFSKRLIDPMIRSYRAEYGMNVIGLAPCAIVGEYNNYRPHESNMVPALIRRFYESKNTNEPLVVWGDGTPVRVITYAPDTAQAYLWCLDHYDHEQFLNVGSAEERTVKEIAFMIADIMGIDPSRIQFDVTKPKGQLKQYPDNTKFVSLSRFAFTPVRETLEKTINFFIANYHEGTLRL